MQLWPNGLLRLGLLTTVVRAVEYDFGASYGIGPGSSSGSAKNAALKYKSVSVSGKGNGRGIDEATLRTLRRGVDLGKPNSLYYMGLICFYGEGLPMDRRLSVKHFRQAAEAGHADAQVTLGLLLSDGLRYGSGSGVAGQDGSAGVSSTHDTAPSLTRDLEAAAAWFSAAAKSGNADGQWLLGRALLEARGTKRDVQRARTWFEAAAAQGARRAEYFLGLMREYGLGGFEQDFHAAARLYGAASSKGDAEAQYNLALMYAYGRGSAIVQDFAPAAALLRTAAERFGHAQSMLMLGKFCMHGHGVPTDYQSALAWFDKAVRAANEASTSGEAALYAQVAEEAARARTELLKLLELADVRLQEAGFAGQPLPHKTWRDQQQYGEAAVQIDEQAQQWHSPAPSRVQQAGSDSETETVVTPSQERQIETEAEEKARLAHVVTQGA